MLPPPEPQEDIIQVAIDPTDSSKSVKISSGLSTEDQNRLVEFLSANIDIFAWCTTDMSGIDPEIICHRLAIKPDA